jgi:hypothetical protein
MARAPNDPQKAIRSIKNKDLPSGLKIIKKAQSRVVIVILAISSILYKSFLFIMHIQSKFQATPDFYFLSNIRWYYVPYKGTQKNSG